MGWHYILAKYTQIYQQNYIVSYPELWIVILIIHSGDDFLNFKRYCCFFKYSLWHAYSKYMETVEIEDSNT